MDLNDCVKRKKVPLSERVKLNVGGHLFETTLATLVSRDGMLKSMFESNLEIKRDPDGSVFIDRDGEFFSEILNFLRSGSISLSRPEKELEKILVEAKFYQIEPLICMLSSTVERRFSNNYRTTIFFDYGSGAMETMKHASKPVILLKIYLNHENSGVSVERFEEAFKMYSDVFEFILSAKTSRIESDQEPSEWIFCYYHRQYLFTKAVELSSSCRAILELFAQIVASCK